MTSARASATRCCCPPDISLGLREPYPGKRTISSALVHARLDFRLAHAAHFQAEGDVLRRRHVRNKA